MIIKPQTKQAAELQNTVPMDTSTIDSGITGEVKAERLEDPENYKFYCETFFQECQKIHSKVLFRVTA